MSFLSAVRDRIASWSAALHGNAPFAPDLEADPPPAHRSPRFRIVIQAPRGLDQTEDVVDVLQSGSSVVLNLERDSYDVARRLLDFVAGVAYHNENQIRRVAPNTFLIVPFDAEILTIQDPFS